MRPQKIALLCAVLLLAGAAGSCKWVDQLKARDQLNKGVGAFRNAQFQQSIVHFKNAVNLDPELLNARLYLATAYAQQYIPAGESPENIKIGKQAVDAFEDVLKQDANNVTAIASIAQLFYNMKEFEKAKDYQRRRLQISPNEAEPYYWIGVINWATTYQRAQQVRKDLNLMMPKDINKPGVLPPLPEKERAQLEGDNGALVEEGLQALLKSIEIKPNDVGAMTYINLMYRQKAEYEVDASTREADLKQADDWMDKALNIRKQAGAQAASSGK